MQAAVQTLRVQVQMVELTRGIVRQLRSFDSVRHGCTRDDLKGCRPVGSCVVDGETLVLFTTPAGIKTMRHYTACGMSSFWGAEQNLPRVILLK